jgi:hypothetical protein
VGRIAAEARSDRVVADIAERGLEVLLVTDDPGAEAVSEQVAPAVPAIVEPLRIRAVEPSHAGREIVATRFDDDVVVRAQQGPGVQLPAEPAAARVQRRGEPVAIVTVAEDERVAGAARRHVPDAFARELLARNPRHVERP